MTLIRNKDVAQITSLFESYVETARSIASEANSPLWDLVASQAETLYSNMQAHSDTQQFDLYVISVCEFAQFTWSTRFAKLLKQEVGEDEKQLNALKNLFHVSEELAVILDDIMDYTA